MPKVEATNSITTTSSLLTGTTLGHADCEHLKIEKRLLMMTSPMIKVNDARFFSILACLDMSRFGCEDLCLNLKTR